MKTYYKNNFIYAELSEAQINDLMAVETNPVFVSKKAMKQIEGILNLRNLNTEEDLRAVRNTIVKELSKKEKEETNVEEQENIWNKMSMVTAVIDNVKWEKGFAV